MTTQKIKTKDKIKLCLKVFCLHVICAPVECGPTNNPVNFVNMNTEPMNPMLQWTINTINPFHC